MLSPPAATFFPGKKWVPRWRTKIWPAFTACPEAIFTPRYLGCESLPSLVEPVALDVAMIPILSEIKEFVKTNEANIVLGIGVVLVSLISFAAGYLVAQEQLKVPIHIEQSYGEQ